MGSGTFEDSEGTRLDTETGEVIIEEDDAETRTYRRSEQIEILFAALCKAQGAFSNAEKSGENPHFRSRYATLEAVLEATKAGRAENGLAIIQMPINTQRNGIGVTTLLGHTSGQWIESTIAVPPGKFDAQGAGSVITYLRRYSLMAILGIAAEDDDGEAGSARTSARPSPPQSAPSGPSFSPGTLASKEQRVALWASLVRTWTGGKTVEAASDDEKSQANKWLKSEFAKLKPPIQSPQELTLGGFRVIMEKITEFARGEEPQAGVEEPDDEFGFDGGAEEEMRRAAELQEGESKKDKGKKDKRK